VALDWVGVNTGLALILLWPPRMGACARARHHRPL